MASAERTSTPFQRDYKMTIFKSQYELLMSMDQPKYRSCEPWQLIKAMMAYSLEEKEPENLSTKLQGYWTLLKREIETEVNKRSTIWEAKKQRAALEYSQLHPGISHNQIARDLKISPNTVYKAFHNKALMEQCGVDVVVDEKETDDVPF